MNDEKKLLGMLGLASRARKLITGADLVCDAIRAGKYVGIVIVASDVSDNTKKRLENCCKHYGVECRFIKTDRDGLSNAVGKSNYVSAVAATDKNFASALLKLA